MKAQFLTSLNVEKLTPGVWKLLQPLKFYSEILGRTIIIPSGFVTDFASVPRYLPLTYSFTGNREHEAAVVHDFLYQTHECENRKQADNVFLEAMKASEGDNDLSNNLMYFGVRMFGYFSWRSGPKRLKILKN